MENLDNFVTSLCSTQHKFTPKHDFFQKNNTSDTVLPPITHINDPFENIILNWKNYFHLSDACVEKLEAIENTRTYSLYTSILYILSTKYITLYTFDQKNECIDEFIRLLISKMVMDITIKNSVEKMAIKADTLIDEIKNEQYQSPNVIFYISVVFDLNIIVLPQSENRPRIEIYSSDDVFDTCKPCIILGRTVQDVYFPVQYNKTSILIYYDHDTHPIFIET